LNRIFDDTDEALMTAAAAGAPHAVDELYRRYSVELRRYFGRYESRRASAEDLVQETFVRVMRYGASYDPARPFRGWLFAIARNVGLGAGSAAADPEALDDLSIASQDDPVRDHATREAIRALEAGLAALAERDRSVLVLSRVEGRSYREVARMLGVSEGAVKVRVFRALQRLRTWLREQGNPGGWLDEH
jgi:RNA polymerase sigma factor (sigma-70 family)